MAAEGGSALAAPPLPAARPVRAAPSFAELERELPWHAAARWRFAAASAATRAAARLSDGLAVGYAEGFDSGPFMEHVYRDEARGRTPLGRLLDRRLLDRPTCVAFRDIKDLARRALDAALDAQGGRALVADLAAGHAPYLLDVLEARPEVHALIGDIDARALAVARARAERLGVAARVGTRCADAFDRRALEGLTPRPDIVLELGLYGMVHDDARLERHFRDLAETIEPAQILFNLHTANPEIEHIARVWRTREGARCVWRLRPLDRVLGWAAAAGYAPASVAADRHGIYRVVRLVRAGAR